MVRRVLSRAVFLVLGLSALMLLPLPCWAQFYAGVYVGAAIPHESDIDITDAGINEIIAALNAAGLGPVQSLNIDVSDIEYDPGVMVGGRVGYWLEAVDLPFLGIEVGVDGSFPEISDQDLTIEVSGAAGSPSTPFSGQVTGLFTEEDVDVLNVGFNALLRYPYGPIQPYGGVGVGIVHAEIDDDDDTAAGLQLIGGVRGFVADNVALFAEYKFVTTEFEFEGVELDYDASHVYGGIEFYFGPGVAKK